MPYQTVFVEFYEQGFEKGINEEIKQINKELGNI